MHKQKADISNFILIEEVYTGWEKKDKRHPPTQRVLDMTEKPLQAQASWKGDGRFILKRIGNDPSSRAWVTSIRRTADARRASIATTTGGGEAAGGLQAGTTPDDPLALENVDNFLVCVFNVSNDIPYAILRVPIKSTAQDVLAQALLKARRLDNPNNFVLVEELNYSNKSNDTMQRILLDDENVYMTQANWKSIGRFVIHERSQLTPSTIHETQREREFYKSRNLQCPKDMPQQQQDGDDKANELAHQEADYHRMDEQVNVCLECVSNNLRHLKRRFIRCSSQATITHLKKFLAKKVLNGIERYKDVSCRANTFWVG
ncbi:hypothetical protein quinque_015998 [Culex quinquefasciatus]